MSVSAVLNFGGRITEVIETGIEFAANPQVVHSVGTTVNLNSATTPDAEKFSGAEIALVAGAKTVDLTALTGIVTTVDGTGKRPRWVYLCNTGAADMTFAKGASNGTDVFGSAWTITLRPGEQFARSLSNLGPTAISGTVKNIDVTGTGTDTFQIAILLG